MKKTQEILSAPALHWVGDGFPVRGMFGNHVFSESVSPFMMNTREELVEAMRQFQSGNMGNL